MSVFANRYLTRSRAVEHFVEDWTTRQNGAAIAIDVEELVRECVDLGDLCRHAWQSLWQILRRDPNSDAVNEAQAPMKEALARTLKVIQAVKGRVAEFTERGFKISNAEALSSTFQSVQEISAKIDVVYPEVDSKLVDDAIAAFKRGECIPIEDLIREAQSGHWPGN
jgi:hypothetical protein